LAHRFQLCILLLCFVGCQDQGAQPVPVDPYARWKSFGIHEYSIDQAHVCFCPESGLATRITVRSDTIVSVVRLSDGSAVSYPLSQYYLTVDSLFGIILNPGSDSLVVTYDEIYGYPKTLDVNPQLHPVDGGILYLTSNLHVP
jgi:hypothetical protein